MPSLYQALLENYSERLRPVRCTGQTVAQLYHYFEDVLLDNHLECLLIGGLPEARQRSWRELTRFREIAKQVSLGFLFVTTEDELCQHFPSQIPLRGQKLRLLTTPPDARPPEHFLLIAGESFSVLMVMSPQSEEQEDGEAGNELIWTFQPEIIRAALDYLSKRIEVAYPEQALSITQAFCTHAPPQDSLPLTATVASRLAGLLQEQAGCELAVNRIATAIRKSLELNSVLQTTVAEVGRTLKAEYCALRVLGEGENETVTYYHFREDIDLPQSIEPELLADLDAYSVRMAVHRKSHIMDGQDSARSGVTTLHPIAAMPLSYQKRFMGVLLVRSDDVARVWRESEILLLRTVADQVTVAVNHARLFAQVQRQAMTDGLTGCYNRRAFEGQMERDLHMATRLNQPLALILLDIDKFKNVNDTYGHDTGDIVLRALAKTLREELRRVDTAARLGGEEFAILLPQADLVGALAVAERLRQRVECMEVPKVGRVTASFGVATFPFHGSQRDQLVDTADRALYLAKETGRNRVCLPPDDGVIIYTEEWVLESDGVTTGPA